MSNIDLHTKLVSIRGYFTTLYMDNSGGGIHLWIHDPDNWDETISIHLTKKESLSLAEEIIARIAMQDEEKYNNLLSIINRLKKEE
jgi:hypothetical protein